MPQSNSSSVNQDIIIPTFVSEDLLKKGYRRNVPINLSLRPGIATTGDSGSG